MDLMGVGCGDMGKGFITSSMTIGLFFRGKVQSLGITTGGTILGSGFGTGAVT